ncbi:MAG TPA: hypothetical protein VFB54_09080 [Burkholderiales bacterium]|nr:hypothetical protein [Burkholderiales bacterium]
MRTLKNRSFLLSEGFARRTLMLGALTTAGAVALLGCQTVAPVVATSDFPGVGRRYLVTFPTFRVELHFESVSSLTWTLINTDGSRGRYEKVAIRVQAVAGTIFLITWQEANKTTVVSVEDFGQRIMFSNITRADGTFLQAKGTFIELG